MNIEFFQQYLLSQAQSVDLAIAEFLSTVPQQSGLHASLVYSLGLDVADRCLRGKRIRPVLCLLICEKFGGDRAKAMPFAIALELIHSFLLVHDDIEDQDIKRRGRDAVWVKYGLAQGINIGDYLYGKAYDCILQATREHGLSAPVALELLQLVTETLLYTGEGQAMDLAARKSRNITSDKYLEIVTYKTGHFLMAALVGGAIIAEAPKNFLPHLRNFGKCLGPAFQIIDDIIDLTTGKGREEKGCDIKEGKRSFLVLYTVGVCQPDEKEKLYRILDKPRRQTDAKDVHWVLNLFSKYRAAEMAYRQADSLLKQSKRSLSELPTAVAQALTAAAEFVKLRCF